jgi:hypothetical protein
MRNITIAGLFAIFLITGCQDEMAYLEKGSPSTGRKVLIAGSSSDFKQAVVSRVISKLGTEQYYFKVIGLERLDKEDTDQYGAILLVAMYAAGRMDGRVSRFLEKEPHNKKVIVFYTIGSDREDAAEAARARTALRVDAISSASVPALVDKRAEELAALIEARFKGP